MGDTPNNGVVGFDSVSIIDWDLGLTWLNQEVYIGCLGSSFGQKGTPLPVWPSETKDCCLPSLDSDDAQFLGHTYTENKHV